MTILSDHLSTPESFTDIGVPPDFVDVLAARGIDAPFPIQALVVPAALSGVDVCGAAKTGSGKTLAFGIPLAERVGNAQPRRPTGLILVPTRELAVQVTDAVGPMLAARGHSIVAVYGGSSMKVQIDALLAGVEVVVATPGRLIDLTERGAAELDDVEVVVIDEADEMGDLGFLPQVRRILRQVRGEHQTMLFSATLDGRVGALVRDFMREPLSLSVESDTATVETSEHRFLEVHRLDQPKVIGRIAAGADRVMVFVRTKQGCDRLAAQLQELGVDAAPIHGDLPQVKRQRTLDRFAAGKLRVLVATNIAARGIHVDGVDVVIHCDPPEDAKTYLHRSGRTARAGEAGIVVTFVEWNQKDMVKRIQSETGMTSSIVKMFSNDPRLDDLAAWQPPPEDPAALPAVRRSSARSRRRNRLL